jgi:hypothetical protein
MKEAEPSMGFYTEIPVPDTRAWVFSAILPILTLSINSGSYGTNWHFLF